MTKIKLQKAIFLSFVTCTSLMASDVDLGTISVESSTIEVNSDLKTESSSVNIISEETIENVGSKNIIDILKTIPGMTNVARTGEILQFRFRGVGNQSFMGEEPGVAIIVDGVPVKSVSGGVRLNLQDIKTIKVVKGSASYLYGEAALSGAVIITTKRANTKNTSSIKAEVGSHGYKETEISTAHTLENFAFNLNGTYRKTDGYWTESEMWTKSVNGKFTYFLDDSSDVTFGADVTKKYDQTGSRGTVAGETEAKTNPKGDSDKGYTKDSGIDLNKYFVTYNKDFDNANLKVTGYKYEDLYDQISNPQDTDNDTSTSNVYVNESHDNLEQQGIKTEYTIEENKIASLIGLEYGEQKYTDKSKTLANYSSYNVRSRSTEKYYAGETSDTISEETTKAIYGEVKYGITEKLTTTVNARHNKQKKEYTTDKHDFDGSTWSDKVESNSNSFTNNAYRLGFNYNSSKAANIYTSVATGFETPDVSDLQETPSLKDQTSTTYEIGSRGVTKNSASYDVTVFQIDNKDIIAYEEGTYGFGSPMANVGDSRHRGLELSFKSDQKETFSYSLAYTYLRAKYTSHLPHIVSMQDRSSKTYDIVGNDIPRVSDHTINLFLNYRLTSNLKLISEIYAKSGYWADEMNTIKMDGYEVLNLQAKYDTKVSGNKLEFYFKIDNVLDEQYYRAAFLHRDKRGEQGIDREDLSLVVDPGRVYYTGVKYTF